MEEERGRLRVVGSMEEEGGGGGSMKEERGGEKAATEKGQNSQMTSRV